MKKVFLFLFTLVLAFSLNVLDLDAQDKADLSGVWSLDKEKSELPQGGGRWTPAVPEKLTIEQKGKNIKIETVYVSSRGERNVTIELKIGDEAIKVESSFGRRRGGGGGEAPVTMAKAEWSGKVLVITEKTEGSFGERSFSFTTISKYGLSGKVLTIDRVRSSQRGDRESKLVYDKAN